MAKAVFHTTILNTATGLPVPNAEVGIIDATTGAYAPLWSDRDGTVTVSPNPTTADSDGFLEVYVTPGRFRIEADDGNGGTQTWEDELIGYAEEAGNAATVDTVTVSDITNGDRLATSKYGTTTGTDTYTFTTDNTDVTPTALYDGDQFRTKFPNTNTGAATIDIDGIGAVGLVDANGSALTAGYIPTDQFVFMTYDATSGDMWLENTIPTPSATETTEGLVELATTSEASAGTDTNRGVTPAGVEAHMTANAVGWGQSWTDVTGSRSMGVTYTNTTGRPIYISGWAMNSSSAVIEVVVDSVAITRNAPASGIPEMPFSALIPAGDTYSVSVVSGSIATFTWTELR